MNDPVNNTVAETEDAVIWAYHLDGKGGGQPIGPDEPDARGAAGGFDWYHLQCDTAAAHQWLSSQALQLHVIEDLTASETRPRALAHPDGLLMVLRGVNTNPGADPEDMVSIRLWLTPERVISARKQARRLLSVHDLRSNVDQGKGPKTPGQFVTQLVERIADRIGDVVDRIDDELTNIETNLAEVSIADARRRVSISRRQTAALRRYLAPQRDALETLFRSRGILADSDAYALREQSDRMARYVEDLDLARERALVLQEELQNRIAEQQNARMYVLSIVAAVFLPLSFLTGVFGMNVAGLPGLETPAAFWYLTSAMGGLALALVAFMRWSKWF